MLAWILKFIAYLFRTSDYMWVVRQNASEKILHGKKVIV